MKKSILPGEFPVSGFVERMDNHCRMEVRMKYLRLYPYHIQLENVAFIEFLPSKGAKDRGDGRDGETARIYFNGRSEPLEIKDSENMKILKRHFV